MTINRPDVFTTELITSLFAYKRRTDRIIH